MRSDLAAVLNMRSEWVKPATGSGSRTLKSWLQQLFRRTCGLRLTYFKSA